ncbi:MAG: DUF2855 family protein [Rubrivivax sp.]
MSVSQVLVRKRQLDDVRVVEVATPPLAAGQVRVRVEHFAYTANNITYAAFGDTMHYWAFYPPLNGEVEEWGCIPVWGFGVVEASAHDGVAVGERLYGYWPMGSHAVLQPERPTPAGFVDGAPHRAALHAVYNQFSRCAVDPHYTPDTEAVQALLRPLFTTAWLIDDMLADNHFFGAAASEPGAPRGLLLVSSASSKTAMATAAHLARRDGVRVVGLTSPRHIAFCESLGVYDQVVAYDEIARLDGDTPAVYVDFAGSAKVREAVHTHFRQLAYSCAIGGTHVADLGGGASLPGPRPVLFFAPAQVRKRAGEWGPAVFQQRLVEAWHAFRTQVTAGPVPWLTVQHRHGPEAVLQAHREVLQGQLDARTGLMLSLAV